MVSFFLSFSPSVFVTIEPVEIRLAGVEEVRPRLGHDRLDHLVQEEVEARVTPVRAEHGPGAGPGATREGRHRRRFGGRLGGRTAAPAPAPGEQGVFAEIDLVCGKRIDKFISARAYARWNIQ